MPSGGRGEAGADGCLPGVRCLLADNPGPLTFGGTRSYVVGNRVAAVIDPGPVLEAHLAALAAVLETAGSVVVLVTHGHADHAAAAGTLARRTGAEVWGTDAGRELEDGLEFTTDRGPLVAVSTPGHSRRHFCFRLSEQGALFTGDVVLGEGDTTWVGEYPGAVAEYLASLDRLEALGARVLYPGHGDPLRDPAEAISRFRRHRLRRIGQVRRALAETGADDADTLTRHVYGALPPDLFAMAASGVEAILDYLSGAG